ncbi:multidrug resistance efflux transporter [Cyclospora cayetanensis]|uniref:Multidrug resistance efflux transporter n=1 Tax=Cyclospora cayetanensis TaxID=88456 RepID=A0A1D3CU54_9EIME|nr:multidrug resistance efflux transporter [Cyclospora cayetanensis]
MPFLDPSESLLSDRVLSQLTDSERPSAEEPLQATGIQGDKVHQASSAWRETPPTRIIDRHAHGHSGWLHQRHRSDEFGDARDPGPQLCQQNAFNSDERTVPVFRYNSAQDEEASGCQGAAGGSPGGAPDHVLSFLPSQSCMPPLLHRYTGTTTQSLLVGVTCCVINIALYITSGVVSRVLQQQEHVTAHLGSELQDGASSPCSRETGGEEAVDCGEQVLEVRIEHLRVPYLMVWLPQACQVFFLFIALKAIKAKYDPTRLRGSARNGEGEAEGPPISEVELQNCTTAAAGSRHEPPDHDTEAMLHAKKTRGLTQLSKSTSHGQDGVVLRDVGDALSAPADHCEDIEVSTKGGTQRSYAPSHTDSWGPEANAIEAEDREEPLVTTNCTSRAPMQQTGFGCFRCWQLVDDAFTRRLYTPYLRDYNLSVQAFLKEEVQYESLAKLVFACFLVLCLYLLQGWFWSIAVGATGMSVCSVTAIYSTNSLFVFLFTSLIYKEGADDFIQMIALILATVGVALIAYESQGEPQSITGVVLSICASATYGLFEVLYKMYLLQNRSNHPLTFVFFVSGIMGALALLFLWVPIPILHSLNYETFPSSPPPFLAIFLLAVCCVCTTIYNTLLQVSLMLLPSPMLVAMCFLLSLPPAAASDALRGGGGGVGSSGCAFIAFSLMITGIKEWNIKEHEEQQNPNLRDLCMPFVHEDRRLSAEVFQDSET